MSSVFDEKTQSAEVQQTQNQKAQQSEKQTLKLPTFEEFKKRIEEHGLYYSDKLLKTIYNTIRIALEQHKVPAFLLAGPAGSGKTSLAQAIADALGAKLLFYQATLNASENNVLYEHVPSEKSKSGIKTTHGILPRSLLISQKEPVLVVIDEIDKTRPSFDAVFLDYLQNARVTTANKKLLQGNPQNLVVFATSNNERELSEPLTRRFTFIEVPPPSLELVSKILHQYFNDEKLINKLLSIYVATQNLKLRKPATIQELILAGNLLQSGLDLDTVLKTQILKYPEDRKVFYENMDNPNIYEYTPQEGENVNIVLQPIRIQNNVATNQQESTVEQPQAQTNTPNNQVVQSAPSQTQQSAQPRSSVIIKSLAEEKDAEMEDVTDKDLGAYAEIEFENPADNVGSIIKNLNIYPSNYSDCIGPFKLVKDNGKAKLICDRPLSLNWFYNILSSTSPKYIDANIWTILDVNPLELHNKILEFARKNSLTISKQYYTANEISYTLERGNLKIASEFKKLGNSLYEARIHIIDNNESGGNDVVSNFIKCILEKYTIEHINGSETKAFPYKRFREIIEALKGNNLLEPSFTKKLVVVHEMDLGRADSVETPKVSIKEEKVSNGSFIFNPYIGKIQIPYIKYYLNTEGYYSNDKQWGLLDNFYRSGGEFYKRYGKYSCPANIQVGSLDEALNEIEEAKRLLKEGENKIREQLKDGANS